MKKNFVKVEMLVNTAYQGPRKEGEIVSVPEDFAKRWVKNGIAKYTDKAVNEPAPEPVVKEVAPEVETDDDGYDNMSPKDLFNICKEKGIDVEAKKSKEYYIEKLRG